MSIEYLLGCCLLDEGVTLDLCLEAGLNPDHFGERGDIFRALTQLRAENFPIGLDTLIPALNGKANLKDLMALSDPTVITTTAHVRHHIKELLKAERLDQALYLARQKVASLERGEIEPEVDAPKATRPITSFAYPEDSDPNMLLGSEDYLGRGGGLLFVSHAGAGKSSWIMDACMMWSLGRAWMQINSHRPRKVLIIQAEDSDRYIGKIFASFAYANQLTPADLALLEKNCVIIRLKGISGQAFFAALSGLTKEHQPDLVIINPIYLYAEGDITRSEFAQPFLLGLDAVNKDEKFAYILIHHTGKPQAKGNNGKRAEVEDWESAYMGFGSSYLANWPRATVLLEPVPGESGRYLIKLGKGGFNAGVTKQVEQGAGFRDEPTTRIAIRHSRQKMPVNGRERPVFYWEMDDAPTESAKITKSGRPPAYTITDFYRWIPASPEAALPAPQIWRLSNNATGISDTGFKKLIFRASGEGLVVLTDLPQKGACYYRLAN